MEIAESSRRRRAAHSIRPRLSCAFTCGAELAWRRRAVMKFIHRQLSALCVQQRAVLFGTLPLWHSAGQRPVRSRSRVLAQVGRAIRDRMRDTMLSREDYKITRPLFTLQRNNVRLCRARTRQLDYPGCTVGAAVNKRGLQSVASHCKLQP